MNERATLQADGETIGRFADALFRYADAGTFASLRTFRDDADGAPIIAAHCIGDALETLAADATRRATLAANMPYPAVFAPPVATFANADQAREIDLANGLALSVECDATPDAARERLESILGPATVIVASGGQWIDPATGDVQDKLHLHWRLTEPTRDAEGHAALKQARTLAAQLVGGDASNKPVVHPIRWPGSWHRKALPKMATIRHLREGAEIDLQDATERLAEAWQASGGTVPPGKAEGASTGPGEARETAELVRALLTAEDYHTPLAALAMRFLVAGMPDGQAVLILRGFMLAVPVEQRDMKDGAAQSRRWQSRFDDIPRAVATARAKVGERPAGAADAKPGGDWPEPVDFLADGELTGAPQLRPDHLPDAIAPFVFDTAARMGVDPASVALFAVISCASAISDDWAVQPKVFDDTWTENPRLWGAVIGDPSIMKTPVLNACTAPLKLLDTEARAANQEAVRKWKADAEAAKADKGNASLPPKPKADRYLVEVVTVEALTDVLRDDDDAKFRTPLRKVMACQDELTGWLADMDRYSAGGKGGGDKAYWLRAYNGGRSVIDRVGRGNFAIPNWSVCVLGGIQPEPIQRIAKEAADDGLLQRFFFVVPAGQGDGEDRTPNAAALARYAALFRALVALRPAANPGFHPRPVVLHAAAHAHREAINALAKVQASMADASPRLKSALGKWPGMFARLALTFHVIGLADAHAQGAEAPYPGVLTEDTAARAAGFMREVLFPHLLRADALLFLTRQTGHARWIAGHILASATARETGRIALRDVAKAYGALRAPEHKRELLEVMESIELMGWLRAEPTANAARTTTAWQVNPRLHTAFAERAAAEREARNARREEVTEAARRNREGKAR